MSLNEVKNVPGQQAINNLYSNDLKINGKADRGIFNKLELDDIYSKIGNRIYTREVGVGNTLASYSDWTHVLTNDGYSIWKYPLADIVDDSNNELYFNDIVLTNSGSADSEITDLGFTKVFISDNKKVGATYTSASSANLDSLSLASITSVTNAIYSSASASLLYTDVIEGSITINSYDTLKTYEEDTDYTVDYTTGEVTLISGSTLYVKTMSSGSSYLISYDIGKSLYVGLSASSYTGFNINLSQNGLGNVYNYYYSSSSFIYFSSLNDYTNNFSVSGNVSWDDSELTGWTTKSVNGTTAYWIKITLNSQGSIAPVAESIYKSTSSIKNILTLTPSQLLNNQYKWGIYNGYIYTTFSNGGLAQNEGVTYIKSTSTTATKQNFFVYNNELKINYKNDTTDDALNLDGKDIDNAGTITATSFVGDITGNADTATTLETTRTIWGQNFNGSANVTGALSGLTTLTASGKIETTSTAIDSIKTAGGGEFGGIIETGITKTINPINLTDIEKHNASMILTVSDTSVASGDAHGLVFEGLRNRGSVMGIMAESTGTNKDSGWDMVIYPNNGNGAVIESLRFKYGGNAIFAKKLQVDDTSTDSIKTAGGASIAGNAVIGGDIYTTAWASFSPDIDSGTGTKPVYATNSGKYKRVGNTVFFRIKLSGDGGDEGSGTDDMAIAMPINTTGSDFAIGHGRLTNGTTYRNIYCRCISNKIFMYVDNASPAIKFNDQDNTIRSIYITGQYEVA